MKKLFSYLELLKIFFISTFLPFISSKDSLIYIHPSKPIPPTLSFNDLSSFKDFIQISFSPFSKFSQFSHFDNFEDFSNADAKKTFSDGTGTKEENFRRGYVRGSGRGAIAGIKFEDTLLVTGWGVLNVDTSDEYGDMIQAYAAGYGEGFVTAEHIVSTAYNILYALFPDIQKDFGKDYELKAEMPEVLKVFLSKQDKWANDMVTEMIKNEKAEDYDFWFHVGLVMSQLQGLVDGYEAKRVADVEAKLPRLDRWVFLMLNAMGDMNDLIVALVKNQDMAMRFYPELFPEVKTARRVNSLRHDELEFDYFKMTKEEVEFEMSMNGMCSAIIKVLPGNEDLFVGHSSWFEYVLTDRIFKHYSLNFSNKATAATGVSFSSYPGFLESLDDFYMLNSGISWTQTSNEVLNVSVYFENHNLKPESLLAWQRVRVSSAMSSSGPDFLQYMTQHYSGTYANQYIIVDYNKFTPGRELGPGTLFVIEEMPGLIMGKDLTTLLELGYFPSYNIPVFDEVYRKSGYQYLYSKFGNSFSYSMAPRAEIFRRDNGKVTDLSALKNLLRSNDFESDIYSFDGTEQNPTRALCSRGDLIKSVHSYGNKIIKKKARGCYDTKVTSYKFGAIARKAEVVNGPTSKISNAENKLQPFAWQSFAEMKHVGLPDIYNFPFVPTEPERPRLLTPYMPRNDQYALILE